MLIKTDHDLMAAEVSLGRGGQSGPGSSRCGREGERSGEKADFWSGHSCVELGTIGGAGGQGWSCIYRAGGTEGGHPGSN